MWESEVFKKIPPSKECKLQSEEELGSQHGEGNDVLRHHYRGFMQSRCGRAHTATQQISQIDSWREWEESSATAEMKWGVVGVTMESPERTDSSVMAVPAMEAQGINVAFQAASMKC